MQFGPGAVLLHSNTPARNASRSDAGGPSLRVAGFEDEDEYEYEAPCEGGAFFLDVFLGLKPQAEFSSPFGTVDNPSQCPIR